MSTIMGIVFCLLIAEFVAVLWLCGRITHWADVSARAIMRAAVAEEQLERWLDEQQAEAERLSGYRIVRRR